MDKEFAYANSEYHGRADVLDLAHWFVLKENMSHKKIQKLCYYAEAWSLAFNNQDIVPNIEFEAWPHGPVNRKLWDVLKQFGWRTITINNEMLDEIKRDNPNAFTEDQKEVLNFVWDNYGDESADTLESISHKEPPWLSAREGLGRYEPSSNEINKELMRQFYSKMYEAA